MAYNQPEVESSEITVIVNLGSWQLECSLDEFLILKTSVLQIRYSNGSYFTFITVNLLAICSSVHKCGATVCIPPNFFWVAGMIFNPESARISKGDPIPPSLRMFQRFPKMFRTLPNHCCRMCFTKHKVVASSFSFQIKQLGQVYCHLHGLFSFCIGSSWQIFCNSSDLLS